MTSVLDSPPPRFTPDEVGAIGAELFGLRGEVRDLGSERDQTFLVGDGILKISNLGEDAATLDLEAQALAHVERIDPELPLARLLESTTLKGPDGTHFVRLFERRHGHHAGPELPDDALFDYGRTHARLARALRSFFHPAAGRELLWDLAHALALRRRVDHVGRRGLAEAVLERYEQRVAPRWSLLPAQVVHGDLNLDNVLVDEHGRISGILDFGDVTHSARVGDLAVALASLMRGRRHEDVFRAGRIARDGYASRSPLEPDELELLGDLVATRLAAIVTISAWRVSRYPENAAYIQSWDDDSWALLDVWQEDPDRWSRELGAPAPVLARAHLRRRRDAAMGALLTPLTYDEPVHVARGEGVWLFEPDGRRLLDAYNNVPVVGHCHPRVTEAVVRQTRALNTHARYLYEPLVELGERLLATMPGLDTVMLVNSGSEANDLAWRIARGVTGNGAALVTEHAYHGATDAIADLSPEEWPPGFSPAHVLRIPPDWDEIEIDRPLAAVFLDAGLTSDGIRPVSAERAQALARATREAGGLFVADEVQVGHGRGGEQLWAYRALGLEPDVVTLGKPMGNGYPVAALVTRRDIVERFPFTRRVFSTFGGNPVAAQAALAVLDVIEDERLVEHAGRIGALLRERIAALGLETRGLGLLVGVQFESAERAGEVVNALRRDGVLAGRTGPRADVLKIRPPLVFGEDHVDLLVAALERAL